MTLMMLGQVGPGWGVGGGEGEGRECASMSPAADTAFGSTFGSGRPLSSNIITADL